MKLILKTNSFLALLLPLQAVVQENHPEPTLRNVKLDFTESTLIATAENLEINCSNKLSLVVKKPTALLVNYAMLLAIVKSITDKDLEINILKKKITITHYKGSFNLPTEDVKEFPVTAIEQFSKSAIVEPNKFKNALKVANRFVLNDDMAAMANISISIGKKIYIRSTDRNRLFEEKVKGSGDKEDLLLSGKASTSLFSLIEDSEELELKYNESKIYFKFGNSEVIVVQQQGSFPLASFQVVLDNIGDSKKLSLHLPDLLTALKRVSILSSKEKHQAVKIELTKSNALISFASAEKANKAEELINVKFSEKRVIGYNYKYLIEILSIFDKAPELYINKQNFMFIKQKKKVGVLAPLMV